MDKYINYAPVSKPRPKLPCFICNKKTKDYTVFCYHNSNQSIFHYICYDCQKQYISKEIFNILKERGNE